MIVLYRIQSQKNFKDPFVFSCIKEFSWPYTFTTPQKIIHFTFLFSLSKSMAFVLKKGSVLSVRNFSCFNLYDGFFFRTTGTWNKASFRWRKFKLVQIKGSLPFPKGYDCDIVYSALTTFKNILGNLRANFNRFVTKHLLDGGGDAVG